MADLSNMSKTAIVVGALAIIVLTVLAVLTGFSKALRTTETGATITGINFPAENATVSLSSNPFVQTIGSCFNASDATEVLTRGSEYQFYEGDADGGLILALPPANNMSTATINCTGVTYLADSSAQGHADTFITGIAVFATFIGVIVLALIGNIIVGLFRKKN